MSDNNDEQQQQATATATAPPAAAAGGAGGTSLFGGGGSSQLVDATAAIQKALEFKEKGNGFVKDGDFKKASFNYKTALMYVQEHAMKTKEADAKKREERQRKKDGLPPPDPTQAKLGWGRNTGGGPGAFSSMADSFKRPSHISDDQQNVIDELWVAAQNNLALSHAKLGRHVQCIDCANKILRYEPDNTKALYRRACGKVGIGELEMAKVDCLRVLELKPEDAGTVAKLEEIKQLDAAQDAKQAAMYRKMFA